ncbi:MAG: proteasome subunit beta, partial [Streptosporangiaceae bacterium]
MHRGDGRVPPEAWQSSSFADFISSYAPDLLPGRSALHRSIAGELPHGTTIVAAVHDRGVVLAGDRRATAGGMISKRDVDKVFRSDEFSAVAIAGTLGLGLEFVNLFQV